MKPDDNEILKAHPLYFKTDTNEILKYCRNNELDERETNGVLGFFTTQRDAFLRRIKGYLQLINRRPYLMIDAIRDSRTCEFCSLIDGKIIVMEDDLSFINVLPPYDIGCRTSVIGMNESQVKKRGCEIIDIEFLKHNIPDKCSCNDWVCEQSKK